MARFCELFKKSFSSIRPQVRLFCSAVEDKPKSSLYISGKRAQETFVVVVPHLDFDERFANLSDLKENVKRRKIDVNVEELKDTWEFYKNWNDRKNKLQQNFDKIGKQINELSKEKENETCKKEIEVLERHRELLKSELWNVKENVWAIEDDVIGNLLKLPNRLHKDAPEKEEVQFLFDEEATLKGSNHLDIGSTLNLIEYYNQYTCFLKNEAAIFELALAEFCVHYFVEKGYIQFTNPDFTRSALAEGVGAVPKDISELFLLENTEGHNDRLHLCGGATLFPFCGFHAKHVIKKNSLPVRYIASGRRYSPTISSLPGLYSVHQSTSVQVFTATWSDEEINCEFKSCLESLKRFFIELKLKFRIVKEPPCSYKNWESFRVSVQIFSPTNRRFIEVGHLSLTDDYISKRLRMCYEDEKGELFLKVVSGTLVNVQTLLALCLERSQNRLIIPQALREFLSFDL